MVRNKEIPGYQSGRQNREGKIEGYVTERRKASIGKHMRTFGRTHKKERMTTYNDRDYFTMLLHTVSSGNCAYFADACVEAYTRGQQVGHMKDEVADQKTAFDLTCDYGLELLLDLSAQWPIDNLLANFPRSDTITVLGTGATTEATIAHYEEATMTNILQRMDKLLLPTVLIKVLKDLNFIFKLCEGWQDVNNNDIPGRYLAIRMPLNASATNVTLINNIWAEQGELKNHCQKFGIKTETFNVECLKPRIIDIDSPDGLAYCQHTSIRGRDGVPAGDEFYPPVYPLNANDSENKKWWFFKDPNESNIHFLAGLLYGYEATYNPYGGAMVGALIPTGADSFAMSCKFTEGTEMLATNYIDNVEFIMELLAAWENHGVFGFEMTGTGVSNIDIDFANAAISWPKGRKLDLFYGTGIDEISHQNTLLSYLIELMF